jgi:hypothetical protein
MSNAQATNEAGFSIATKHALLRQSVGAMAHIWFGDIVTSSAASPETVKVERWALNDEGHPYPTGKFIDAEVRAPIDWSQVPSDAAIYQYAAAARELLQDDPNMTVEALRQALRSKFPISKVVFLNETESTDQFGRVIEKAVDVTEHCPGLKEDRRMLFFYTRDWRERTVQLVKTFPGEGLLGMKVCFNVEALDQRRDSLGMWADMLGISILTLTDLILNEAPAF